jgi:glycosyltransferase involved in cell wall biosynthesis
MGTRHAPAYERPKPRDPKVPVTVVIAARNASAHIGACVASVANWADEVLVVENDSTDDTVLLASVEGATVFAHPFTTIGGQRNAAIARARHRWILVLDADERCTAELAEEVAAVIAAASPTAAIGALAPTGLPEAYRVRRRNFFLGREIRHGGWERDRPVRLFRRHLRYDPRPVHEHVVLQGVAGVLAAPMLHYTYSSLDEYFEKFGRYSAWWAEQAHERGRHASLAAVLLKPPARFVSMYVIRLGFLDGAHGLVLAVLAAMSVAAKYARLWGLGRTSVQR